MGLSIFAPQPETSSPVRSEYFGAVLVGKVRAAAASRASGDYRRLLPRGEAIAGGSTQRGARERFSSVAEALPSSHGHFRGCKSSGLSAIASGAAEVKGNGPALNSPSVAWFPG